MPILKPRQVVKILSQLGFTEEIKNLNTLAKTVNAITKRETSLSTSASIEQFLEWFPGVKRSQVEAVLNYEVMSLADSARS